MEKYNKFILIYEIWNRLTVEQYKLYIYKYIPSNLCTKYVGVGNGLISARLSYDYLGPRVYRSRLSGQRRRVVPFMASSLATIIRYFI